MIKIAFFDVDGTLLKMGHKELSERTLHALISLHRNGVKLCMATGRGYLSAPRFPGIDFDALLTFNGSYVTVGDEIIFKCPLDRMDKLQILQNLKDMHRAVAISNEHFIITNGTDPDLEQYFRFGNEMLKIDKQFDERVREDIYQMMCACREEEHGLLPGAPGRRPDPDRRRLRGRHRQGSCRPGRKAGRYPALRP